MPRIAGERPERQKGDTGVGGRGAGMAYSDLPVGLGMGGVPRAY